MIDPKLIRENPDVLRDVVRKRGIKFDFDTLIDLDVERRKLQTEADERRAEKKLLSKKIAGASPVEKKKLIEGEREGDADDSSEERLKKINDQYQELLWQLPNIPWSDVPEGKDESDNQEIKKVGEIPNFRFPIKDSLTLGESLDIIDVKRAGAVSGSRFGYLKGACALLEFALINYALDSLLKNGFVPVVPPVMVKSDMMKAMGFLAHGASGEVYQLPEDDLYLVGTSEQTIGPMHAGEVLPPDRLPLRYASFSTCFRRESGSYGKDTRGILRVHQFDKLEMFSITAPEQSEDEHAFLLSMQEQMWKGLEVPYRVVLQCTGDMGYPSARTYDIEAWIPSEDRYREVTSTSTTTDYQSRALDIRTTVDGKKVLAHMLNGTAFAVGRAIIAILENHQTKEGTVRIPNVLHPYMHGVTEIMPRE